MGGAGGERKCQRRHNNKQQLQEQDQEGTLVRRGRRSRVKRGAPSRTSSPRRSEEADGISVGLAGLDSRQFRGPIQLLPDLQVHLLIPSLHLDKVVGSSNLHHRGQTPGISISVGAHPSSHPPSPPLPHACMQSQTGKKRGTKNSTHHLRGVCHSLENVKRLASLGFSVTLVGVHQSLHLCSGSLSGTSTS